MRNLKLWITVTTCLVANYSFSQTGFQKGKYFNLTNFFEYRAIHTTKPVKTVGATSVIDKSLEATTINGFFLTPQISLGLGVGVQLSSGKDTYEPGYGTGPDYAFGDFPYVHIPVFIDFRYYLQNQQNTPVLFADAGYSISNDSDEKKFGSGPLFKVGVGYKIRLGRHISLVPNINAAYQRYSNANTIGGAIGVGLMFY